MLFDRIFKPLLGCMLLGLLSVQAMAEEYPTRAIKIIVGFGPGGAADSSARIIAQKLSENMGKAVFVENLPGAGGIIAASTAAKAPADGYTLFLVANQNAVSPSLMKSLPYDPVRDFSMISTIAFFDLVMVTDSSSPFNSVNDVIQAAKRDSSRINIGTVSIGSTQHLSAELFKSLAGLDVPIVPFRNSGDVLAALKSGTVQVGFETLPAVMAQIKAGSLRALAVTSAKRSLSMPQVTTIAENGMPSYSAASWTGLAAPAKTPVEIIARLNREVAKALASPETKKRLQDLGIEARSNSPAEFKTLLGSEIVKWRGVIERAKIEKQ